MLFEVMNCHVLRSSLLKVEAIPGAHKAPSRSVDANCEKFAGQDANTNIDTKHGC